MKLNFSKSQNKNKVEQSKFFFEIYLVLKFQNVSALIFMS